MSAIFVSEIDTTQEREKVLKQERDKVRQLKKMWFLVADVDDSYDDLLLCPAGMGPVNQICAFLSVRLFRLVYSVCMYELEKPNTREEKKKVSGARTPLKLT